MGTFGFQDSSHELNGPARAECSCAARCLVFAGHRTPVEEARIAERNRHSDRQLLFVEALGSCLRLLGAL